MAQFDPSTATADDKPAPPAGFDPSTAQPFKEQGTISRIASDVGRSLKAGVQEIPGQLAGLADIAPALAVNARPITKLANAAGEATGFEPGKWAEQTSAAMSPEHQAAAKEIQDVWDSPDSSAGDIAMAYARNPAYVLNIVARSAPSMLLGGLAGRAAMGVGHTVDAAGKVLPGLLERTAGEWAAPIAGGVGEGAVQAGQQMQQDEAQPNQRANAVAALGSGAIDAAIGAGSGRVANALGFETLQTALAGGKRTGKVLGPAARIALGAADEGLLQELPQSAQEQVWQNWAEGKPLWDGVPRQAIEGALAGLVMGAGANAHGGGQEAAPTAAAAPAAAAPSAAPGPIDFQDVGPITPTPSPGAAPTPGLGIPAVPGQLEPPNRDTGGLALAPLGPIARAARLAPPPEALPQPEPEGKKGTEGATAAPPPPAHFPIDPSAGPISHAAAIAQGIQTPPAAAPAQAQAEPAAPRETQPFVPRPGDIVVDSHFERVHSAATSPLNSRPEPTAGQKAGGNYLKGHTQIAGLDVTIENPQGSTRSGVDAQGKPWESLLTAHYGYIRRSKSSDGEQVDAFVKPGTPHDYAGDVYVVDQIDPKTGLHDEPKAVIGATSQQDAERIYRSNYTADWQGLGAITPMPMADFKKWVKSDAAKLPVHPSIQTAAAAAPDRVPAPAAAGNQVQPAGDRVAVPAGDAAARRPAAVAQGKPAEPARAKGLRVGITPADAEAVTVKDGVVYVGKYAAANFETGEPVRVPEGAGAPQIAKALRDAGALPKRAKVFGMNEAPAAGAPAPVAEPKAQPARGAAYDRNPFLTFLATHGLFHEKGNPKSQKAEFSPDKQVSVPGYHVAVFRKTGKMPDALLQPAIEEGYLPQGASESQLEDLIRLAVQGKRVIPVYAEGVAQQEFERQQHQRDEGAAQREVADFDDDVLVELAQNLDDVPSLEASSNVSTEAAMRALGFTEEEIRHALEAAQRPEQASPDGQGHRGTVAPAQGQAEGPAAGGNQQARPEAAGAQDLLGVAPNESQQAAHRERARRGEQTTQQQQAAPGQEGFTLGMVDARNGQEVSPNQQELLAPAAAPAQNATAPDSTAAAAPVAPVAPEPRSQQASAATPAAPSAQAPSAEITSGKAEARGEQGKPAETAPNPSAEAPPSKAEPQPRKPEAGQYALAEGNTWRSDLTEALSKSAMKQGPAAGWLQAITGLVNAGKVKADEVEWSGIRDWLQMQGSQKVPKEAVLDFLRDNGVRVEETVKGTAADDSLTKLREKRDAINVRLTALGFEMRDEYGEPILHKRANGMDYFTSDGEQFVGEDGEPLAETDNRVHDLAVEYGVLTDKMEAISDGSSENPDGTRYASYTLPGGENYRELLLTLPTVTKGGMAARKSIFDEYQPRIDAVYAKLDRAVGAESARLTNELRALQDERNAKADAAGGKPGEATYRSAHWDEPNILAHIRMNDRTDAEGRKVLFIEEIQSDWAQEGRRKGFRDAPDPRVQELKKKRMELIERMEAMPSGADGKLDVMNQVADVNSELQRLGANPLDREIVQGHVARAPFVEKTDAWLSLALKRIVKYAADNGYYRVAFVNGEQSADRYDLSKQISRVRFEDNHALGVGRANLEGPHTRGHLLAYDLDGRQVIDRDVSDATKELPDLIGKEAAAKLLEQRGRSERTGGGNESRVKELKGLDLKVGGEGMKAFYDKIVPSVAKDVLKKLGGGGMREVRFPGQGNRSYADLRALSDEIAAQVHGRDTTYDSLSAEEQAKIREMVRARELHQTGFDVTPAMREAAAQGMPLFAQGEGLQQRTPGGMSLAQVREKLAEIKGMPVPRAQAIADSITKDWKAGFPVRVVPTASDLPGGNHPANVRGLYQDGTGYVVASAVKTRQDVGRIIAHEVIQHYGMRNLLGEDNWKRVMLQIQAAANAGNKEFAAARQWVREVYRRPDGSPMLREGGTLEADELAARLIERSVDENGNMRPGLQWLKWVWAKIAGALRAAGLDIPFTTAELHGIWVESRRALEQGTRERLLQQPAMAAQEARGSDNATMSNKAVGEAFKRMVTEAEDELVEVLFNWEDVRLNDNKDGLVSYPGRDAEFSRGRDGGRVAVSKRAFFEWLASDAPLDPNNFDQNREWRDEIEKLRQIVQGTSGRSAPQQSMYALSDAQLVGNTGRAYTSEQERAMRNVGFVKDPVPLKEKLRDLWKNAGKLMAQGLVDQFAPIKDISREAYGLLRLSKGASGAFEVMLHGGQLKLVDGVYDYNEKKAGGVIQRLLVPLQGEHHDFFRWVAANRAEQLMAQDREHLFSADDIRALKTLADGELAFDYTLQHGARAGQTTRSRAEAYGDSLATFNEFNKNTLDLAQQSGLIDGESRALWEKEFYVPFYRIADEGDGGIRGMNIKSGVVRQQAFKQLKGGAQHLNADLLENTLMNWAHLLDAAAKNRAAKATLEAMIPMGAAIEAREADARGMAKAVGKRNNVVWFMDEGRQRNFLVDDPYLLAAVSALEYAGFNSPIMKAMGTFKHALTVGVTASPFFKVRNLIRDSIQAIGTGPLSYNMAANLAQGWAATAPGSERYFRLMAGGGTIHFGTMMEGSEAKRVQALVEAGVDRATILDSADKVQAFYRKTVEPLITAYNELGNRGEAVNRAALYEQLRRQGVGHAEASLQARDLMDFSMQGSFTTVRFLTQVVPFMNARIQGLWKLGRAAAEDPARFSAVLGATAMLSIGLLAAYSDDDDWKKREDFDRNNWWWFKAGGVAYRIPKPFEVGAIATLAERTWELAFNSEMTGQRFRDQVISLMGDNLSMNPIPQVVKPVLDVYANKDSFTNRPIETMGMEKLQPQYRYRESTTMAARGLSTALNAGARLVGAEAPSPVQIDHLVQGYFSWLGSMIVSAGDVIARPATDQPQRPQPDYWKVLSGSMVSSLQDAPSRYVSAAYTQAKQLEEVYGTWRSLLREGKVAEAQAFREDYTQELVRFRQVEAVRRAVTHLNQLRQKVEQGDGTPEQKRERVRELNDQADRVARRLAPTS